MKLMNITTILIILGVLILAGCQIYQNPIKENNSTVNDVNDLRKYISKDQAQCAASDWICEEDMQQFYDETGCGCKPINIIEKQEATECANQRPEVCTLEYNPVCGEIVLNTGETTYKTFGNSCNACSAMKTTAYTPGECENKLFVVCKPTATGFDPVKYAEDAQGICVDRCPEGFDAYMTQTGIELCIQHYGEAEISRWNTCKKSTNTCNCAKAYETTTGEQISDSEYKCVPQQYEERLLFRGGLDSLDENGKQAVMIA